MRAIGRGLRALGRFWWDFLVGDTPELFVVMVVLVGLAFALRHDRIAAVVLLPVIAAVAIVGSAYRGRRDPRAGPPLATEGRRASPGQAPGTTSR